jgi:SAM-dependent methyltransferase
MSAFSFIKRLYRRGRYFQLWSVGPVSRKFGWDAGQPIDRYYIERFLHLNRRDIHGRVLEVADSEYTRRFGEGRVERSDVLHVDASSPGVTIAGDLLTGEGIPRDAFDCIVLTQTLQFTPDVQSAISNARESLKSGGVLLATMPGISQISRYDMDRWGEYWRFTDLSVRRLFEGVFGAPNVTVETEGNALVSAAFLYGMTAGDFTAKELDVRDEDYQLVITVRSVRK